MSPLKLSPLRIAQLEEMLNFFYKKEWPEIYITTTNIDSIPLEEGDLHNDLNDNPYIIWFINKKKDEFQVFHWFEFCWTDLTQKVTESYYPIRRVEFLTNFALVCYNNFPSIHPVNYLYDEFKKIKTEFRHSQKSKKTTSK